MISEKIDLTENRDFMGIDVILTELMLLECIEGTPFMGYRPFKFTEKFFGKKQHDDQRVSVFGIGMLIEKLESRCDRCGERLKPWKSNGGGLCEKCEDAIMSEHKHFPWNPSSSTPDGTGPNNLFNLR